MATPVHMNPFVVPVEIRTAERHGIVDLYFPEPSDGQPRPAVVFVHGGPVPADLRPTPREWPMYQAYGSMVAERGFVGATVDHRLHALADYPQAADDVAAAVELVRADPRVDADRVAIWFFSGGSMLTADWLREPPPYLRCIAANYPLLGLPESMVGTRFQPAQAVTGAGSLPIVLVRVGLERPEIAATVETFAAAARACGAALEIIDVPDGQHSFDILDHTDQSQKAVGQALDAVLATLS